MGCEEGWLQIQQAYGSMMTLTARRHLRSGEFGAKGRATRGRHLASLNTLFIITGLQIITVALFMLDRCCRHRSRSCDLTSLLHSLKRVAAMPHTHPANPSLHVEVYLLSLCLRLLLSRPPFILNSVCRDHDYDSPPTPYLYLFR